MYFLAVQVSCPPRPLLAMKKKKKTKKQKTTAYKKNTKNTITMDDSAPVKRFTLLAYSLLLIAYLILWVKQYLHTI